MSLSFGRGGRDVIRKNGRKLDKCLFNPPQGFNSGTLLKFVNCLGNSENIYNFCKNNNLTC